MCLSYMKFIVYNLNMRKISIKFQIYASLINPLHDIHMYKTDSHAGKTAIHGPSVKHTRVEITRVL